MKISVIIPTYNCPKDYLREAIESVLSQTLPPLEVIVVDDGSTDDTQQFVSKYTASGVRYLYQTNSGQSAARNLGIRSARGDWIAFLDHDDVWLKTKLERQAAKYEASHCEFIVTDMYKGKSPDVEKKSFLGAYRCVAEGQIFDILIDRSFIFPSSVLVHKRLLEKHGGFDEKLRLMEDLDLFLRIAQEHDIAVVPEILVFRRLHDNNFTNDPSALERKLSFWVTAERRLSSLNSWHLSQIKKHCLETEYALAYSAFKSGRMSVARTHFRECVRSHFCTASSMKYIALTCLPVPLLRALHSVYRRLVKPVT